MPIDILQLRPERGGDPERWRQMTTKRFKPVELVDNVIDLDTKWRKATFEMEQGRKQLGILQKEITAKMKAKADASEELAKKVELEATIAGLDAAAKILADARDVALELIPNELDPSVPVSNDEKDNIVVRSHGKCRPCEPGLLHHNEILWMIDGYEDKRGSALAGHRGYFLKGPGVLLNQALINYALAFLIEKSYVPLQPPFFMNKDIMAGVAQLADFDEQLYKVSGETEEDAKYLIATSEQPICAYHRGDWIAEKDLPKKYAGYSTCFRKEAGSAGRDNWGIFRIHQFEKVEQFVVCPPSESAAQHEEMIGIAEDFYKSLGLAYHVINIVSGELNNAAAKKYDLEAWFPSLGLYRELVSASNCTDYQSRAMEVRLGLMPAANKGAQEAGSKKYVHYLNSTLCATERTICCILENYQTADGVKVPDVLVPYMGGRTFLPFTREKPIREAPPAASAAGTAAASNSSTASKKAAPEAKAPAAASSNSSSSSSSSSSASASASAAVVVAAPAPSSTTPSAPASSSGISGRPVVSSAAGLSALNTALLTRSYVAGESPSAEDEAVFNALSKAGINNAAAGAIKDLTNVVRWINHIAAFSSAERAAWPLTFSQLNSGAVDARASTIFTS